MTQQSDRAVLVVGAGGMLSLEIMKRLAPRVIGLTEHQCDITDPRSIDDALYDIKPQALINCAAYTDVDGAERDREIAWKVNGEAPGLLAVAAARRGIPFVHVSSDFIFSGEGNDAIPEDAPEALVQPISHYGASKLEGERRVMAAGGPWIIARTQWLYGAGKSNFIDTIARLAGERPSLDVVDDQVGAATWTRDLAEGIAALLKRGGQGVYHVVNSGWASRHEVARRIVDRLGLTCEIKPCATEAYPRPAGRPKNTRLSQQRYIELTGAPLRSWDAALEAYITETYG